MGQAKIRKQKLGALYGTPEGSNAQFILKQKAMTRMRNLPANFEPVERRDFASPALLDAIQVDQGIWPVDNQERKLIFHPDYILEKLNPKSCLGKVGLTTGFIEYCKGVHYLWINKGAEPKSMDAISAMRLYLSVIENQYGADHMCWAISQACITAQSCDRMIDVAADGIGGWRG